MKREPQVRPAELLQLHLAVGHNRYGRETWAVRTRHVRARRALWAIFKQTQALRTRPPQPPRIFWDL